MVHCKVLLFSIVASGVNAFPIQKRIAQVISASTTKWEAACLAAGGGEKCNPISVTAFSTLLAAAGPCDQQDSADAMVDLAKSVNDDASMISFAQIFAQQPRNSPNSVSIPYCQTPPRNGELDGLFQCQFQGSNLNSFVGDIALGGPGTFPFGHNAALNPLGSCPAHTSGPIADGTQLTDLISSPGVVNHGSSASAVPVDARPTPPNAGATAAPVVIKGTGANATSAPTFSATTTTSPSATSFGPSNSALPSTTANFRLQNGKDAQALNAKFVQLSKSSSCTEGEEACVSGDFAQCVSGSFVTLPCGSGTTCFSLPLVNAPGTSIACTTEADALYRISDTGSSGGIQG